MKIPTVNVVVGFDREVMSRLFSAGATYESLMQGISGGDEDALLFDNENNPNFISFEHSMNFGQGMRMRLEFIDPKNEFEKRFITDNAIKNIAGFRYNDQSSNGDVFSEKKNKAIRTANSEYKEEYYNDLLVEYRKHFGTRELYVAYGCGDNLDLWSGPHRTILQGASIDVKGPKKVSLTLVPTDQSLEISHRRGAYNEKVNLNLAGLTMRYAGSSKEIKFKNYIKAYKLGSTLAKEELGDQYVYNPLEYLDLPDVNYKEGVQKKHEAHAKLFGKLGLEDLASTLGEFDIHSIVVDTLRSYIQKATNNPNVIVLLPNINIICRKLIDETAKNSRIGWDTSSFGGSVGSLLLDTTTGKSKLGKAVAAVGQKENFLNNLLQNFGCELHSVIKDSVLGTLDRKAIPQQHINAIKDREKSKSADDRMKLYYDDRQFYSIIQKSESRGIPDHMRVVRNVLNSIKKYSKEEYQMQVAYLTETDTDILDLWSSNTGTFRPAPFYTFGGYNTFNEKREAIIVGDLALIQQYLYGKVNIKLKKEDLNKLKSGYAKAKKRARDVFNNLVLDKEDEDFSELQKEEASRLVDKANAEADAYAVAALKNIPLHPLDRYILTNNSYISKITKIINPITEGDKLGPFGDISYIPDDFAFIDKELTQDKKKYIKEQGIPVFRFNTQNPNVLDLKFDYGAIYFANLKMGFSKMVERKASAVAAGALPLGTGSFPIKTRGDAIAYLRLKNFAMGLGEAQKQEILTSLAGLISPELVKKMSATGPEHAADAIAAYLTLVEQDDLQGYVAIEQLLPGNPHSIMTDFTEQMYRNALQMQIKTLPMFHLAGVNTINDPCILFAQDKAIKQTVTPQQTLMNSFFSGLYKIMGFRHEIKQGSAQSEFKLVKNKSNYNIEADNPEEEL